MKIILIRDELDKILKNPSMLIKATDPYFNYISQVWAKFEKIPHLGYGNNTDYDYFARLKENIIIPLKLNPDEH